MRLTRTDLQQIPHREFRHAELLRGRAMTGVSTDSRTTVARDLFFALRGPQFDGHAFVGTAIGKGAVAAVVDTAGAPARDPGIPLLVVDDTTRALGDLAHLYRAKFDLPIVAVGGSNGKTTTKEMIAAVLGTTFHVLCTEGNLNNQIGVPLTLFRLERKHQVAVVEIGTNHPGEIRTLCAILRPTHGLITNIGHEHLEYFGSLEGVAEEEGALWDPVWTPGFAALVNADDPLLRRRAGRLRRKVTYGFTARDVDVKGVRLRVGTDGCATFGFRGKRKKDPVEVHLQIPGVQSASNALAAAAVGLTFHVQPARVRKALEQCQAPSKRMEVLTLQGTIILDDTYNANPDSVRAALNTLCALRITGKRIAVLADMLELGAGAPELHAEIGAEVRKLGIEYLLTFGKLARHIKEGAAIPAAVHYDQKNILSEYLRELIAPGDAVLIKGSRGMKMEDVVTFLKHTLTPSSPLPLRERGRG